MSFNSEQTHRNKAFPVILTDFIIFISMVNVYFILQDFFGGLLWGSVTFTIHLEPIFFIIASFCSYYTEISSLKNT